ncbi:hypothetical protein AAMO2058_000115600 [Amorphochlora amoebiformis]
MGRLIKRTWTYGSDGRLLRKEDKKAGGKNAGKGAGTAAKAARKSPAKAAIVNKSKQMDVVEDSSKPKTPTTPKSHKLVKRSWTFTKPDGSKGKRLQRKDAELLNVGKHVRIYHTGDKKFHYGKIIDYQTATKESMVLYTDGAFEWIKLGLLAEEHKVSIESPNPKKLVGQVVQIKMSAEDEDWKSGVVVGYSDKKKESKLQFLDATTAWVSLDDLDSKNLVQYRPPDALKTVGTRVKLYWPQDKKWYVGTIVHYSEEGESKILYKDGSWEYVNLEKLHDDHQLHYTPADVCGVQGDGKAKPSGALTNKWISAHKSMYIQVNGKRYDRGMLKVASEAEEKHGKIGMEHAPKLVEEVIDGGVYSDIEKETMKHIRGRYEFTPEADEYVRMEISRFVAKKNFKIKKSKAPKKSPGKKEKNDETSKSKPVRATRKRKA